MFHPTIVEFSFSYRLSSQSRKPITEGATKMRASEARIEWIVKRVARERRLFWGFGWDDLRPRRYERTNGHKVPSSGSQWSSECSTMKSILKFSGFLSMFEVIFYDL